MAMISAHCRCLAANDEMLVAVRMRVRREMRLRGKAIITWREHREFPATRAIVWKEPV